MDRVILHCDCNGFYASVECLLQPSLRQVPMAVCGDPDSRHGIILAKNELAKGYGIQTAETLWQARQKCPELVLVPPHREEYLRCSRLVNEIYQQYTDQVEPFGIDESWLDVTGSRQLFGEGPEIADQLRRRVREEVGLTISVGVSFNKVFAKLGSDYRKPDATTVITRENFRQIVHPLPVSALLYVGRSARQTLESLGIHTIGQLAEAAPSALTPRMGKLGPQLIAYARGEEDSPVRYIWEEQEVKSVGNSITFPRNLTTREEVNAGITALADEVAGRLRKHGLQCATVQIQIKDPQFRVISRQKALEQPTDLEREIRKAALELVWNNWTPGAPIRMLAVTGAALTSGGGEGMQLTFYTGEEEKRKRQRRLEQAMDRVRDKYGKEALSFGRLLHNDLGLRGAGKERSEENDSGDSGQE
ncbi:DNA polymerase IV [Angelakisella massiliensis]|uniref:DNA polymerase IV n=1 Tax=Angelakisella massiliensis TaxID=1871018 RepID=UPI0008F92376|nr:DNA polymerase IV [Angelakisella massiliensis]